MLNENNLLRRPSAWETIDHIDLLDEFPMLSEEGIGDITLGMNRHWTHICYKTFLFQASFNWNVLGPMRKKKSAHRSWQQPLLTPSNGADHFQMSFGFQLNQRTVIEQSTIRRSIFLQTKFSNGGAIVGLEIDFLAAAVTSHRRYGFFPNSDGNQVGHVEHRRI